MRSTPPRGLPPIVQLVLVIVLAATQRVAAEEHAANDDGDTRPPNIVFILVDDLGWRDLGCFGSDLYETPHLDRLADEGMRFTNAYAAASVCSPTRASILTGKSPATLRITDWIPGVRYPHAAVTTPNFCQELPLEEVTLAETLRAGGYRTLHVGKWHLGGAQHDPLAQGFDVNIGGHAKGAPATYFHPYQSPPDADVDWSVKNLPPGGEDGDYLTDRLTDEALRLIRTHQAKPFFLHLAYYTVHTPIEGKPALVDYYRRRKTPNLRQQNATYAAMVHSLDQNVGRVLHALRDLGLARRTVVVFTSDNGGVAGITSNAPLRAGKGMLYEGGIREPLIVRWPGHVPAGTINDAVVTSVDFYPTLLEIAGVPGDAAHDRTLEGVSLVATLRDPRTTLDRDAIHWHYPHYHTPTRPPASAIRSGRYKLIEFLEDGRVELYDLETDIGESRNLADALPAVREKLVARLRAWRERTGAAPTTPNPRHDAERPFRAGYTAWGVASEPGACPQRH